MFINMNIQKNYKHREIQTLLGENQWMCNSIIKLWNIILFFKQKNNRI